MEYIIIWLGSQQSWSITRNHALDVMPIHQGTMHTHINTFTARGNLSSQSTYQHGLGDERKPENLENPWGERSQKLHKNSKREL